MLYVQQVRSRKDALVPIRRMDMENDLKIEIVDMSTLNNVELVAMDTDQIFEVVAATPAVSPGSISPCLSPAASETSSTTASTNASENPRPRKRAKLDHLSQEEKAQHRKMMNRISAQSARDRQKAFIHQQERAIKELNVEVEGLRSENKNLKGANERLTEENESLKAMVEKLERQLRQEQLSSSSAGVRVKVEATPEPEKVNGCCASFEPAVLSAIPLQKGLQVQQTLAFLILMWAFSLLIWTPPSSLKHLKHFLEKSLAQTHPLLISRRTPPLDLATEKRSRVLQQGWAAMKADIPG